APIGPAVRCPPRAGQPDPARHHPGGLHVASVLPPNGGHHRGHAGVRDLRCCTDQRLHPAGCRQPVGGRGQGSADSRGAGRSGYSWMEKCQMTTKIPPPPTSLALRKKRPSIELPRLIAPLVLASIMLAFTLLTPTFLAADNLLGVLNQSAILALVASGMTVVVRAGGIDLSIGVALDLAALAAAAAIADHYVPWVAVAAGLAFGLSTGLVNALLIVALPIPPFLATLSVWFIGTSVQQLLTGGGAPGYLVRSQVPEGFALWGNGQLLGIPL